MRSGMSCSICWRLRWLLSVCGAESCVNYAEFAEDRELLLREFPSLQNGLPSHDTFSRLFRRLDPAAFGQVFSAFLHDLGADGPGVMAIDGKTLRRSCRATGHCPALRLIPGKRGWARVCHVRIACCIGMQFCHSARRAAN